MDTHSVTPGDLLSTRLLLLRDLAHSLEISQDALAHNDAELIARGAAHQAELCRQWSALEDQLRRQLETQSSRSKESVPQTSSEPSRSAQIEVEFTTLTTRIRHLTRVHCSLLRHLQRSLAIVGHLLDARAPTYTPELNLVRDEPRPQAGG
jgi:hypothetical protein